MREGPPPRAWLFVPGDRPDRFAKAVVVPDCGMILDLEDAVVPGAKAAARDHVTAFLGSGARSSREVAVRINPVATRNGIEDALALLASGLLPDAIVIPKVEGPESIALLDSLLTESGSETRLIALIESARGLVEVAAVADASPRLAAIMFGAADYAADLGQDVGTFDPIHARAAIVNAAAINGLRAIDSPFFAIDDRKGLADSCRASRGLGFHGKAAIHPAQVAEIVRAFAPSAADVARARRILDLSDGGAAAIDGKMIDIAILRWARTIISEASR
jgi:citrate lyase beta subunit